jgi:hypothetical protein
VAIRTLATDLCAPNDIRRDFRFEFLDFDDVVDQFYIFSSVDHLKFSFCAFVGRKASSAKVTAEQVLPQGVEKNFRDADEFMSNLSTPSKLSDRRRRTLIVRKIILS